MTDFIMPAIKPQCRGRKSQTFYFRDLEGAVYEVHSIRRFSELTNIPLKSFYALTSGRANTLYGITVVGEDEEIPENVRVVTSDTGK